MTAQAYVTYRWMVNYWFLAIPVFLVVDAAILAVLEALSASFRWLARFWFSFVLFAAILYLAYLHACVIVPLSALAPLPADVETELIEDEGAREVQSLPTEPDRD
jgi:hypothetical protein